MPRYELNLFIDNIGSRNDIRMKVVNEFAKEEPGLGKNDLASQYTYYVESLNDNRKIYLKRPAYLHNGFDFVVCVEGINFNPSGRRRDYPTHDDILDDLKEKYYEDPKKYEILFVALSATHACTYIDLELIYSLHFKTGFPCDLLIKTLKWLFIEQDIRYWNYSGRDMLWKQIYSISHQYYGTVGKQIVPNGADATRASRICREYPKDCVNLQTDVR